MSNKAPLVQIEYAQWLQAFRGITNATNERTVVSDSISGLAELETIAPVC